VKSAFYSIERVGANFRAAPERDRVAPFAEMSAFVATPSLYLDALF